MGLATRPDAGKGRKNGTVKALMPSCYTGRKVCIRTNLQGIDGRSQMHSAFPCLVHANAHDSWQCSTFEGQICSRAFGMYQEASIRRTIRLVNLQILSAINPSRGGFSSGQWLSCSTFRVNSHPSVQNLSALRLNYQLRHDIGN